MCRGMCVGLGYEEGNILGLVVVSVNFNFAIAYIINYLPISIY